MWLFTCWIRYNEHQHRAETPRNKEVGHPAIARQRIEYRPHRDLRPQGSSLIVAQAIRSDENTAVPAVPGRAKKSTWDVPIR